MTGYDSAGNPTSVQQLDASGNTLTATSATFDGEGDQLSATDADGNSTTFTYNPTGMLSQEVQPVSAAAGITTSFGYYALGRLTADQPAGSAPGTHSPTPTTPRRSPPTAPGLTRGTRPAPPGRDRHGRRRAGDAGVHRQPRDVLD